MNKKVGMETGVTAHTAKPSIAEAMAGTLSKLSQPGLHNEFYTSQIYKLRPCLKTNKLINQLISKKDKVE